jgi:hypothetical protein
MTLKKVSVEFILEQDIDKGLGWELLGVLHQVGDKVVNQLKNIPCEDNALLRGVKNAIIGQVHVRNIEEPNKEGV